MASEEWKGNNEGEETPEEEGATPAEVPDSPDSADSPAEPGIAEAFRPSDADSAAEPPDSDSQQAPRRVPLFERPKGPPRGCAPVLYLWAGIIAPLICLAIFLFDSAPLFTYQSGWNAFAAMLLAEGGWPFYPFLLYAMLALAVALFGKPDAGRDEFILQLGIAVGLVLSFQYCLILIVAFTVESESTANLLGVLVIGAVGTVLTGLLVAVLLLKIGRALHSTVARTVIIVLLLLLWLVFGVAHGTPLVPLFIPLLLLFTSPFWTFVAFVLMANRIGLFAGFAGRWTRRALVAVYLLLGGYILAWFGAIREASHLYADLPASSSGCYVATAAARGHAGFVGSVPVLLPEGHVVWMNRQLRVLKAAERVMMARWPRFHRGLRAIYDAVGPAMARRLANPWLADAAYLALKPFELLALAVLHCPRR